MKTVLTASLTLVVLSGAISGCGGSSSTDPEVELTEPPVINQAKAFDGPLSSSTSLAAERYIKNGIYAAAFAARNEVTSNPSLISDAAAPTFTENFSTTNTAEQGVDEADRIEYDGDYLYLATTQQWLESGVTQPAIKVMQRNADFTLTELDQIQPDLDYLNINGLYLYQDRLAVIGNDFPVYPLADVAILPWYDAQARIGISIHDVSTPSDTSQVSSIEIDGNLLSSRRIENNLYIVSTYTPYIDSLDPTATTEDALLNNYKAILATPASAIMPKIHSGQSSVVMNDINDCFIPADATIRDGHAQLITVTRINLDAPEDRASTCLSTFAFMTYTSQDSLYIASNLDGSDTHFHKLSLSDLQYQASGKVTGQIGWRGRPNLRTDEQDGHLRVVSTDYSGEQSVHKLTILNQQGNQLQPVAELPNASQPEAIGKPNEDIYAVRFIEDKAYVVTFERVDPLYVIDLSDQQSPFIAGSLEIPGFSSYLHPLKNDLILGVGQAVEFAQIPSTGEQPIEIPVTSGLKVSLFDARDPENPIELTSMETPYAYSPVEFDYKAFTVLENAGAYRFAMPMEQWRTDSGPANTSLISAINSLLLLETDTNVETPELVLVDKLSVQNNEVNYIYSGEDRSVLHGDSVYYIHGNQIWLGQWMTNSDLLGPY